MQPLEHQFGYGVESWCSGGGHSSVVRGGYWFDSLQLPYLCRYEWAKDLWYSSIILLLSTQNMKAFIDVTLSLY